MKKFKLRKKKLNESTLILNDRIDTENLIKILETLFAEEILAWYQYYIPINFMNGPERSSVIEEFKKHADDELNDHANKLLKRISELGGDAENLMSFNLKNIAQCEYLAPQQPYSIIQLIIDNIKAEKCAIQHYITLCDLVKDKDFTTYEMAVDILADEEEHLNDLKDFYYDIIGEPYKDEEENKLEFISMDMLNTLYNQKREL
jgi:bacterioferritin